MDCAISFAVNVSLPARKPFIELCESVNNTVQVIIAGEAFEELENVNTITLEGAYK